MTTSTWSFRVALTNVCVTALAAASGQADAIAPLPSHLVPPANGDGYRGDSVTDITTIYRFWNQFLDVPLPLPSGGAATVKHQQQEQEPEWASYLHFCYDGMEKEVVLEVLDPSAPLPDAARASSQCRGAGDSNKPAAGQGTLLAVSKKNTFFSYSIEATSATVLAQSLANRYAAVHVLLRRVKRPRRVATGTFGFEGYPRTPPPMKQLVQSISNAGVDHHEENVFDDGDNHAREVIVLASATMSLLDLAICEDDRFYLKIFTNTLKSLSNDASLHNTTLSQPDRSRPRHRAQLCGQISLTLRMDEEREVNVRPRLICLRGELPAASYHLRYGWCANDALSLSTRQKRRQASTSRETSPSRPPEHLSTDFLIPGVVPPRVTFKQDQLSPLQLTCSRAALVKQFMFLEVFESSTENSTKSEAANNSVSHTALNNITARGEVGFERFIVAAHHDSEIEAAFTVHCGVQGNDSVSPPPPSSLGAAISCEVEAVLHISNIPNVRYALIDAAVGLTRQKEKKLHDDGRGSSQSTVQGYTASRGPIGPKLGLLAAIEAPTPRNNASTKNERKQREDDDSAHYVNNNGDEVPRTARPTEEPLNTPLEDHDSDTGVPLGTVDHLMTPPQSLRNYRESLALSQAPFAVLSFAASPNPVLVGASDASEMRRILASLPRQALQQADERHPTNADLAAEGAGSITTHEVQLHDHSEGTKNSTSSAVSSGERREKSNSSPSSLSTACVPHINVLAGNAHRPSPPHPLHTEALATSNLLHTNGISIPSTASPTFRTEGNSSGEPSASLPPRATPHAQSALVLKKANSLESLFPSSMAHFDALSKKNSDAVIQLLISGGKEYSPDGNVDPPASPAQLVEMKSAPLNNGAVCDTMSHGKTALGGENEFAITQCVSPLQQELLLTVGKSEEVSSIQKQPRKQQTEEAGETIKRSGDANEKSTGSEFKNLSMSSCRHAAVSLPDPPKSNRPISFTAETNTNCSQTQCCHLSSTVEGSMRLPQQPARAQCKSLSKEEAPVQDVACTLQLAAENADSSASDAGCIALEVTQPNDERPQVTERHKSRNGGDVVDTSCSRHLCSLDPELVLHFTHIDSDSDDSYAKTNDSVLNQGAAVAQLSSIAAAPESSAFSPSALHNSSVKGRGTASRSVTSLQLSPAPPPTLAPPPPEAPPHHLLNGDALPHIPTTETERNYATSLWLSAQYRTLLKVYTQKLARVRAAEIRAGIAKENVQAAQTRLRNYVANTDLTGESGGAGNASSQAAAEWLERARHDKETAQCTAKEARKRTRALRQRLTDMQAAHRAARAQLQSQDEALRLTEEELQQLLCQLIKEREELMTPTPPPMITATTTLAVPFVSPPNRYSSSARVGDTAAAVGAIDFVAQQQAEVTLEGQYRAWLTELDPLTLPVAQSPNTGAVRISSSRAAAPHANAVDSQSSFLQPPSQTDLRHGFASSHSPNPRDPALANTATGLALRATSTTVQRQTRSALSSENDEEKVSSKNVFSAMSDLNRRPSGTTPVPPTTAAPAPLFQRPLRYSHTTPSPSPFPARSAEHDVVRGSMVRYAGESPPHNLNLPPEKLSALPLSRLEQEALLDGIDKGDRPLVMHLLHTKPQLFLANNNLLHVACAAKTPDLAIVETLLRMRPELTHSVDTKTGNTVLHAACAARYPCKEIVKQLLIEGVSTKQRNRAGLSAFHVAVLNNADIPRNQIKDTLLTLGDCDVNERTTDGRTALHLVCESDHFLPVVQYLLLRGADAKLHAIINFTSTGESISLTPLQLSRVRRAEEVAHCIKAAASEMVSRYATLTN